MPTQVIEVDPSIIGLIRGTDQQVGGDIWNLFTTVQEGGQGSWSARVGCNQEYRVCPVKGGSTGIICDAVNTDREEWEGRRVMHPLPGAVCCGKAPGIQTALEEADSSKV